MISDNANITFEIASSRFTTANFMFANARIKLLFAKIRIEKTSFSCTFPAVSTSLTVSLHYEITFA